MQPIVQKVNGDFLQATEWNQPMTEVENIILSCGITLSGSDLYQLSKAVAGYAANGNYYIDSGIANAYVLNTPSPRKPVANLQEGMIFRFIPINSNTGATTVNVAGLGVVNIISTTGNPLIGGEIIAGQECYIEYDGANFIIDLERNEITTGDIIISGLAAKSGWIPLMTLGTIGSASSGATIRANDDCYALFIHLWTYYADAQCPVITGRGSTAAADWTANKQITIPASQGRALAIRASQALGFTEGSATHTLSITEMPSHNHTQVNGGGTGRGFQGGGTYEFDDTNTATTGSTGGGGAHNNIQPTIYFNALMRL